jgi:hypothetical protein
VGSPGEDSTVRWRLAVNRCVGGRPQARWIGCDGGCYIESSSSSSISFLASSTCATTRSVLLIVFRRLAFALRPRLNFFFGDYSRGLGFWARRLKRYEFDSLRHASHNLYGIIEASAEESSVT